MINKYHRVGAIIGAVRACAHLSEKEPNMTHSVRVLLAGESWETLSFHQKGFDVFTTTFYYEGAGPLRAALESAGHAVEYMPSHIAATKFPTDLDSLRAFDVVV